MKNLFLLVLVLLVSTTTLTAQIFGVKESKKYEASVNYLSGKFTDNFTKQIYSDRFDGFEISLTRTLFVDWIGIGLSYKSISEDGTPITYGYEDPGATTKISINSWGPEVFIKPFKFLKIYTRYGSVNIKEDLNSQIGNVKFDEKGNNLDLGFMVSIGLYEGLNMILKTETSTSKIKKMDKDSAANRTSFGFGLGYKF